MRCQSELARSGANAFLVSRPGHVRSDEVSQGVEASGEGSHRLIANLTFLPHDHLDVRCRPNAGGQPSNHSTQGTKPTGRSTSPGGDPIAPPVVGETVAYRIKERRTDQHDHLVVRRED